MKKLLVSVGIAVLALPAVYGQETAAADTVAAPVVLTLDQALRIALSENVSVKVADMEIEKTGYARKGTYAALFPTVSGSASYQRTIKKQVMYMDFDMSAMGGGAAGAGSSAPSGDGGPSSGGGIEVGRWNTWSAGVSASMPLVNAQLWKSLRISDTDVEIAVEKARNSRLETVTQVKQAFYACLLARKSYEVYKSVYDNAVQGLEDTQKKYNVQRASELDLARAKTTLANAIPDVYDSESAIILALWRLKALMGVDLDANYDVAGDLSDYADQMFREFHESESMGLDLDRNSSMRQLALQAEELADYVKLQEYATLPSLAVAFSYNLNAMTNDFKFSEYKWSPYSYVGLSLSIPIFAGGKYHSAIKQAKVQSTELELQRQDTERQLKIAIRSYLNTMETAMNSYASANSAVESAGKAYDIAKQSYNVGRSTYTDLMASEVALTSARLSVCTAIYSFMVAKSSLEQTIGADFIDNKGNVQLNNM